MNYYYRKTEAYYNGFQKMSLFTEPTFRISASVFAAAFFASAIVFAFYEEQAREATGAMVFLFIAFPAALASAGGMSLAAWFRFIVFAGFAVFAIAGSIFIAPSFLVFAFPAFLSLAALIKSAPKTLSSLGYAAASDLKKEAAFSLLTAAVFITVTYFFISKARGASVSFPSPAQFVFYLAVNIAVYGPVFGIIYGLFTRALLDRRFELSVPVLINTLFVFSMWAPNVIGSKDPVTAFIGSLAACLLTQVTLTMAFYF
ncbi:MAG TPA: hypothetical protein PLK80_14820, partial [bacterium]|nr:hypothetical protein [bacterium]